MKRLRIVTLILTLSLNHIFSQSEAGAIFLLIAPVISALLSIGTLATEITRRLDYTYYSLLEKITALNTTITSFQGLADSTSTTAASLRLAARSAVRYPFGREEAPRGFRYQLSRAVAPRPGEVAV